MSKNSSLSSLPADTEAMERACKEFACHLISAAYEDLQSWAGSYQNYRMDMREQLLGEFEKTDLWNLFLFFVGAPSVPSGLELIIEQLELDLKRSDLLKPVQPLLLEALIQANYAREALGLPPYAYSPPKNISDLPQEG